MSATIWRKMNARRDHRWAANHFSDYADGALPTRQERRLAAHEEICPDCGRVARTLRRMLALLPGLRAAHDPGIVERAREAVARRLDEPAADEPSS